MDVLSVTEFTVGLFSGVIWWYRRAFLR